MCLGERVPTPKVPYTQSCNDRDKFLVRASKWNFPFWGRLFLMMTTTTMWRTTATRRGAHRHTLAYNHQHIHFIRSLYSASAPLGACDRESKALPPPRTLSSCQERSEERADGWWFGCCASMHGVFWKLFLVWESFSAPHTDTHTHTVQFDMKCCVVPFI